MEMGITRGALTVINDLLDNCCEIKAGQEVVIAAQLDGLQGGDNLVDTTTISWIQQGIQARGANCTILWLDEVAKKDAWRTPPVFLAALKASDAFINCSFDLTIEEQPGIQRAAIDNNVVLCRNFATTVGLLNSPWAQTPYELVTELRYQSALPFGKGGAPYVMEAENGTYLEGTIGFTRGTTPSDEIGMPYARYRKDIHGYRPFPEWICPPVNLDGSNGQVVFDRTLGWWSRYLDIPPVFKHPVKLMIENGVIVAIEGKEEARKLKEYLKDTEQYFGSDVYKMVQAHGGAHPCTKVSPAQCSHPLYTRIIDHSGMDTVHVHIGDQWVNEKYPYRVHLTADIKNASWKVGDKYVVKNGRLTAFDTPSVKEIMKKYPDRPGVGFVPQCY